MARRKSRKPNEHFTVRAHITIGARDHALWCACASLAGMDRSAFAVEALRVACSGLILVDKRKNRDQAKVEGSAILPLKVDPEPSGDAA